MSTAPEGNPLFVFEHSLYVGLYLSGILYGMSILMYFATMRGLLQKTISRTSARARRFFAIYSTILFLFLTIDVAVNAFWAELAWINGRDFPKGGVTGYISANVSVWYQTMGSATVVAMIFMGDALLLYRMYVIWSSNIWVLVVPILAYLVAFALAIIQLVVAAKPGATFFGGKSINFGTPYYAITISLNVVVTLLICYRLRRLSKTVAQALGRENARMYTSVASMLVESAAPYSVVGIMFLIPYALESQTAISFGQVWAKLTCLCPQMIIFRVISGKAWAKEVVTQAESTVIFGGRRPAAMSSGIELRGQNYSTQGTATLGGSSEKWDGQRSTKSLTTSV